VTLLTNARMRCGYEDPKILLSQAYLYTSPSAALHLAQWCCHCWKDF